MHGSSCVYSALRRCQSGTQISLWRDPLRFDYRNLAKRSLTTNMRYQSYTFQTSLTIFYALPQTQNQEEDKEGRQQSLIPAQIRFDGSFYLQSWIRPAGVPSCGTKSLARSGFQQHQFSLNMPHFKGSLITDSHSETCNVNWGTSTKNPGTFYLTFPALEVCSHLFSEPFSRSASSTGHISDSGSCR